MLTIDSQKPSLDLRIVEDDDLRLSCRSNSSNESTDEHDLGGRVKGRAGSLVGDIEGLLVGDEGEKFDLEAGVIIPFRLGDLNICFPLIVPGSCKGNQEVYLMSCMVLRCSTMVLIVGLSDGSTWRHF